MIRSQFPLLKVWHLISYAAEFLISEKYGRAGTKLVQAVQIHVDVPTFTLLGTSHYLCGGVGGIFFVLVWKKKRDPPL